MAHGWMLLALQIAIVGPEPTKLSTGMDCPSLRLRAGESVNLTRLCSEAAHLRYDADGADAACRVAGRLLTDLGPSVRAALDLPEGERQDCLPDDEARAVIRAMNFTIEFLQFRHDGSVQMPAPFAP